MNKNKFFGIPKTTSYNIFIYCIAVLVQGIMLALVACDFSVPTQTKDELPNISYSSSGESVKITNSPEGIDADLMVELSEGQETVLSSAWDGSGVIVALYTITPENDQITIDSAKGIITIASSATKEDSGDYTVAVSEINGTTQNLEYIIRIEIKKAIDGNLIYTSTNEKTTIIPSEENDEIDSLIKIEPGNEVFLDPSWSDRSDEDQTLGYTINPVRDGITIDPTTGTITISSDIPIDNTGDFVATASGTDAFVGQINHAFTLSLEVEIDGVLNYTSTSDKITIVPQDEDSDVDSISQVETGQEILLDPEWSERTVEDPVLTYTISPENQHLTIDSTVGTISIAEGFTTDDAGDYTVLATGVLPYNGQISHALRLTTEKAIDGILSYSSTSERASVTPIEDEESDKDSYTTIEQTHGVSLAANWTDRTDDGQTLSYAISPESTHISIDSVLGTITVTSDATFEDSETFTIVATGNGSFSGQVTHVMQIKIGIPLDGFSFSYEDVEIIEKIPLDGILPTWADDAVPDEISYTLTSDGTSNEVEVDATTGVFSATANLTEEGLATDGLYTVEIVGGKKYFGTLNTEVAVTYIDWCDSLDSGFVPERASETEPYEITNWKELLYLSFGAKTSTEEPKTTSAYKLTKNIKLPFKECSVEKADISIAHTPIGAKGKAFKGTFDGGGYSISGIHINNAEQDYVGLFGILNATASDDTIVKNLTIKDVEISANAVAGALAGALLKGMVKNVHAVGGTIVTDNKLAVTGITSPAQGYTGGLVGGTDTTASINQSSASVTVEGVETGTGGLVGYATGAVQGSATGNVTGVNYTGGLVGYSNAAVQGYATGSVTATGSYFVGGLVGYTDATVEGYARGAVTAATFVGGLVGFASDTSTVQGYATGNVDAATSVGGLIGSTSGSASGYATGSVSGSGDIGGLIGKAGSSSVIYGYARGTILSKYRASFSTFGEVLGSTTGSISRVIMGYYSTKPEESTFYQLSETGDLGDYEGASTDAGTGVSVAATDTVATLKTKFDLFNLNTGTSDWEGTTGHWPAIILSSLADLEGAIDSTEEQKVATAP